MLSARGAQRLLGALPVRGPVDLWINHQFENLEVFATQGPLVKQRKDYQSTNVHSILPVLSQVGVLTRERPLLVDTRPLPGPVFAFGESSSGLTSLAMALSMLGYRCCSDLAELPMGERTALFANNGRRVFNAYVNVGSLTSDEYLRLAKIYRGARFIITVGCGRDTTDLGENHAEACRTDPSYPASTPSDSCEVLADELRRVCGDVLVLRAHQRGKWESLCDFLECDHQNDPYPEHEDQAQRELAGQHHENGCNFPAPKRLKRDVSPWIAPSKNWQGIRLGAANVHVAGGPPTQSFPALGETAARAQWVVRDDTFPSNLALFTQDNICVGSDEIALLTFRHERTAVREFTSGAICSRPRFLYGRFVAEGRPANVPGLITGMFLHRNSPRQEIDVEFLGNDTTKMLVNVYYNPGFEGARMEYGYRGTPALIDLGFDAHEGFHRYEIEWCATAIRWRVDGRLVHERANWDPTPIPHLPMQFNVNLWHSRSDELAGRLVRRQLPAHAEVRAIDVYAQPSGASGRAASREP